MKKQENRGPCLCSHPFHRGACTESVMTGGELEYCRCEGYEAAKFKAGDAVTWETANAHKTGTVSVPATFKAYTGEWVEIALANGTKKFVKEKSLRFRL